MHWIGSWITLKIEDFSSLKSRGAGPVPQHFIFNFNQALTISIRPPIQMGSQSQQKLWCEKSFCETHFALRSLPLSRRSRCVARHLLWLSSIIENPKKPKVCKHACRTEAELETGHTRALMCTFPVWFFGFAFIFNSTICWILSTGSCC